jgi:hypothetical protein
MLKRPLEENQIRIHLEVQPRINLSLFVRFNEALILEAKNHFGPTVILEIAELESGSLTEVFTILGSIAAVGTFVLALEARAKAPRNNNQFGNVLDELAWDNNVTEIQFEGKSIKRGISRDDLPRLSTSEQQLEANQNVEDEDILPDVRLPRAPHLTTVFGPVVMDRRLNGLFFRKKNGDIYFQDDNGHRYGNIVTRGSARLVEPGHPYSIDAKLESGDDRDYLVIEALYLGGGGMLLDPRDEEN